MILQNTKFQIKKNYLYKIDKLLAWSLVVVLFVSQNFVFAQVPTIPPTTLVPSLQALPQDKVGAEKLVDEGVAYHDKGDYEGAIVRYDKALQLDKDNLLALSEKALSLLSINKNDESIEMCKKAIATHPSDKMLKTVYVTYGNAMDAENKTDKSIEIYDEGIKKFPEFFMLYFNKGVTLSSVKKYDEALPCFQMASFLNPEHPGTQNAMGRILFVQEKNIPALLALGRFLVIEPHSDRSENALNLVQQIMKAHVNKTGKNQISITLKQDGLAEKGADGKKNTDNFRQTEMMLGLSSALDYDEKYADKTEVENFIRKFDMVCSSLAASQKKASGFYWEYYAPYYIEMHEKHFTEAFSYIIFASSEKTDVLAWLKAHQNEIDKFYDWSEHFDWKKK